MAGLEYIRSLLDREDAVGAALSPKVLGLSRIWLGAGPRDFAYAGYGYRIAPVTRRYWRLSTVGGDQIATASTCGELLTRLAALLNVTPHDLDAL